ncbi:MAG: carboxypeptidase-like regulatory domain-containing protein, partial [Candidatus Thiodiazotropha sp. (ex Lucinoma borealis)]|nr:carboxypeptidase-like regulatory domain-containing protein [Candidatus Thiodiazotropha sp. (ex Lucinoma borealis)]
ARHDGSTVSPHGYRGLTASAFSLPWRSAIADEHFPTLHLKIENQQGQPVANAVVELPFIEQVTISDIDGAIYALVEIPDGAEVKVTHPDYQSYQDKLVTGTNGDYVAAIVTLT